MRYNMFDKQDVLKIIDEEIKEIKSVKLGKNIILQKQKQSD